MRFSKYYKGYRDPHEGLRVYSQAAKNIRGLAVFKVPMHIPSFIERYSSGRPVVMFFKLFAHFFLFFRLYRNKSNKVIIREFLTVPLFVSFPLLWGYRKKIYFLCQHNLAFASRKVSHRLVLRFLNYIGFQFLVYESVDLWSKALKSGSSPDGVFSIPHPVGANASSVKNDDITVGIIGNFRKEKSPEWAIKKLIEHKIDSDNFSNFRILIGSPDQEFLDQYRGIDGVSIINTKKRERYLSALQRVNILFLPYDESAYSFRVSGVLSEAVSSHALVVAPCLPGIKEQLSLPSSVGECYVSRDQLLDVLDMMLPRVKNGYYDAGIQQYLAYRGRDNIKLLMERLGEG